MKRWIMDTSLSNIDLLEEKDLEKMNFYETALYIQTLNEIESLVNEEGDINE